VLPLQACDRAGSRQEWLKFPPPRGDSDVLILSSSPGPAPEGGCVARVRGERVSSLESPPSPRDLSSTNSPFV